MRNSIFYFTLLFLALGCVRDNSNLQLFPEYREQKYLQKMNFADTVKPAYLFELIPAEKYEEVSQANYLVGWIRVSLPDNHSKVQTIPVMMNEPQKFWVQGGLLKEDVNFDGYMDIGILWHGGAKWGRSYWWLYNPQTKQFYNNSLTAELNELTLADFWTDPKTRQIKITRFDGAEIKEYSYQVDEEHIRLVGSRYIWQLVNGDLVKVGLTPDDNQ